MLHCSPYLSWVYGSNGARPHTHTHTHTHNKAYSTPWDRSLNRSRCAGSGLTRFLTNKPCFYPLQLIGTSHNCVLTTGSVSTATLLVISRPSKPVPDSGLS